MLNKQLRNLMEPRWPGRPPAARFALGTFQSIALYFVQTFEVVTLIRGY